MQSTNLHTASITLSGLIFSGIHGVYKREKHTRQNFEVTAVLQIPSIAKAVASDNLADAVDYRDVKEIIRNEIEEASYNLIEVLIETMASKILLLGKISGLEITLTKKEVWGNGAPSITIRRGRIEQCAQF